MKADKSLSWVSRGFMSLCHCFKMFVTDKNITDYFLGHCNNLASYYIRPEIMSKFSRRKKNKNKKTWDKNNNNNK